MKKTLTIITITILLFLFSGCTESTKICPTGTQQTCTGCVSISQLNCWANDGVNVCAKAPCSGCSPLYNSEQECIQQINARS